jgi:hypothetical protein
MSGVRVVARGGKESEAPLFARDSRPCFAVGGIAARAGPPAGYVDGLIDDGPRLDRFDEEWTWNAAWAAMTTSAAQKPAEAAEILGGLIAATRRSPHFEPLAARPVAERFALVRLAFPLLVAIDAARREPGSLRLLETEHGDWLTEIVTREANPDNQKAGELSSRNNHALLAAAVNLVWAGITGEVGPRERGLQAFRAALAGMEENGCLPNEAVRGASAAWYTNLAIMLMVSIAHAAARPGVNLFEEKVCGHSLDHAIGFLLAAIDEPDLLWSHSRENRFPHPRHGADPFQIDLTFLETYHRSRHYLAWVPLYLAHRGDGPHSDKLRQLLRRSSALLPMINEFVGGAVERMLLVQDAT